MPALVLLQVSPDGNRVLEGHSTVRFEERGGKTRVILTSHAGGFVDFAQNMLAGMEERAKKLDPNVNLSPDFMQSVSSSLADPTWRFGAMFADAREGRVERVKLLITFLEASYPLQQAAAALSLPWYLDESAIAPLETSTHHTDETLRLASAWALAALKTGLHNQRLARDGE